MKRFIILFAVILIISSIVAQGLGDFQLPGSVETETRSEYWIHQTFLKTVLITVFSVLGIVALKISNAVFRYSIVFSAMIVNGFIMGGFLCPTTSVQNIFFKFATGYLIMFLIPLIFSFFVGRVHCGFVCPYGAIQEILGFKAVNLPKKIDSILKKAKYFILAALVILVLIKGDLVLRYMPFRDLFSLGISVSVVFWIILSTLVYRPFCRYLCPYGALLGLISKFSLYKLRINEKVCVSCGMCEKKCKAGAISGKGLDRMECLLCGKCKEVCGKRAIDFKVREVKT